MLMIFFFAFDSVVLAHVPHDVVVDLELSPAFSRDKTIFAIVYWKIFRSIDGGYEWHRQSRGLCSHGLISLVISPTFSIDKTLFVSCIKGEVYRSQDAGRSWTLSSNGLANLSFVSLVISPRFGTDHTILALGSQGEIYQTEDAGENWKRVFHQELNITAMDWAGELVVFGTGSGELYVSENSGTKWKKCGQHPNSQKITCIELPRRFSSDEPFFIGAGKEGVFRVINGGSTFQDGSSGMSGKYITSLASFYKNDRIILFASTWKEAIFRSEDAGTTWKKHGSGLMKSEQAIRYLEPHFKKIVISDDLIFFLGGFCGVFRSDDRGQTWLKLETLLHHITGLDLSPPTDSGFTIGIATYGGGAYSTSDGGVSWKINNCGLIYPRLGPIVYSPNYAKDRTVFTATYGHIMKSSDGGAHWNTISLEPPKISIEGVKNRIKRVLSGSSLTLSERISLLRFNFWTDTEVVIPIVFAISPGFSVDQTVFVGMYPNGLLRSQDGGYTFSLIWDTLDSRFRSLVVSPE